MKFNTIAVRRIITAVGLAAASLGLSCAAARAQGFEFYVTPYLWASAVHTKVKSGVASGTETDVPFRKILGHLDMVPVIIAGEARYGRFGLAFDLIWLKLKSKIETSGPLFDGGGSTLAQLEFTTLGLYRVVDDQMIKLDAGAGFRLWNYDAKLKLNSGILAGRTANVETTFIDPIFALRANIAFAPDWSTTLYGDIGGFGLSSKITWQLMGTINYQIASWAQLRAGYRYLTYDRKNLDNSLHGPITGATFRF